MTNGPATFLTVNPGSSSLKIDGFDGKMAKRFAITIEGLGSSPTLQINQGTAKSIQKSIRSVSIEDAVRRAFEEITRLNKHNTHSSIKGIGVRIVHGGNRYRDPLCLSDAVLSELETLGGLAPLHNSIAVRAVREIRKMIDIDAPIIGVFDTAFHRTIPTFISRYAIPDTISKPYGIRRFGFHGLAHEYMLERYAEISQTNRYDCTVITLQLGSGCSACAIQNGESIDTSMGFTPMEGLMMRTRSGDIDPGVLLFLENHLGMKPNDVTRLINKESGLAGISGTDGNMKTLLKLYGPDDAATLAVNMFCYRIRKYVGAYMAALHKPTAIIFGGGIGEHAPLVRELVLKNLDHLGITLDLKKNNEIFGCEGKITADTSRVHAYIIPVDESAIILKHALPLI